MKLLLLLCKRLDLGVPWRGSDVHVNWRSRLLLLASAKKSPIFFSEQRKYATYARWLPEGDKKIFP